MSDLSFLPLDLYFAAQSPSPWTSLDRLGKAEKARILGVHEETQGRCGRTPPPTPLPWLLGQGGLQQLQDTAYQVQAACDQHVDGSSLLEDDGPAAGHRVSEEAPWGTG